MENFKHPTVAAILLLFVWLLLNFDIAIGDQGFYVYKSPDPDDMKKNNKQVVVKGTKNEPSITDKHADVNDELKKNPNDELLRLAKSDDETALFNLGMKMYYGRGVECDKKEGTVLLMRAAEKGKYSEESLGIIVNENYNGKNVPKNYIETRKWLNKLLDTSTKAQNDLAFLCFNGLGGPVDYNYAFELYLKSAMRGYSLAQANLGTMYLYGIGTKKDKIRGYAWYDIASINGNEIALLEKKKLMLNMTPDEMNSAQNMATELFRKISDSGESGSSEKEKGISE